MVENSLDTHVFPVIWQNDHVVLIDQRQLPEQYSIVTIHRYEDIVRALKSRIVQGGSALGIAAAYGLYLAAKDMPSDDPTAFWERIEAIGDQLKQTRPDKKNLRWAVDQMLALAHGSKAPVNILQAQLLAKAQALQAEDFTLCHTMGNYGLRALPDQPERLTLFTHCNHGALATSGYGTSLGVVRSAWREGRLQRVFAGETRPNLQGARLTAWECVQEGIPVTVVIDSMAAHCMQQGWIHAVLVGADCIAANGDTINKIGTYGLALAAKAHNIPFFVVAPLSTLDAELASGQEVSVTQHAPEEIYKIGDMITSPDTATFYNPAVDVTPAHLVTAFITEEGPIAPKDLATIS
jgi:methylthioribose-1-phosphate isomerase